MSGFRTLMTSRALHGVALLFLCGAYLQGALEKAFDFASAIGEMQHFGLAPAAPLAVLLIVFEIGASLMVLSGFKRWLGALALAVFTVMATFVANRFWQVPMPERQMIENAFFEHWGLAGGFLLVAWHDLKERTR